MFGALLLYDRLSQNTEPDVIARNRYCILTSPHYLSRHTHFYIMHNPVAALVGAAFIPLIVGALWYSKPLFANSWMRINRFQPEDMSRRNMALIFGLTVVFSFLLAVMMQFVVIHQAHLSSIIAGRFANAESKAWLEMSMGKYGMNYRTFGHGVFHGILTSIFLVLPVLGIIALFERRSWKYVLIHLGFWTVSLALMGGVICQFW